MLCVTISKATQDRSKLAEKQIPKAFFDDTMGLADE
jgi:hypothetical protein